MNAWQSSRNTNHCIGQFKKHQNVYKERMVHRGELWEKNMKIWEKNTKILKYLQILYVFFEQFFLRKYFVKINQGSLCKFK